MILSGKQVWITLGAALLVGGVGGSFLSGWKKAQGIPEVSAAADAGTFVQVDAGVHVSDTLQLHLGDWTVVRIPTAPPPARPRAAPDAGPATVEVLSGGAVCPDSFVMLPTMSLSGTTRADADTGVLARANAGAQAQVQLPKPGLQVTWDIGGGIQHNDDQQLHPTVNGALGIAWGENGVKLAGGVAPLRWDNWNVSLLYGGRF